MLEVVELAKSKEVSDGEAVWEKLKASQAFCFSFVVEVFPPPEYWQTSGKDWVELTQADTLTNAVDEEKLKSVANKYKEATSRLHAFHPAMDPIPAQLIQIITSNSRYKKEKIPVPADNVLPPVQNQPESPHLSEIFTPTAGDELDFDIDMDDVDDSTQ